MLGSAAQAPAPAPRVEDFSQQLQQLVDMGFVDADENLVALRATGGVFEQALEYIIAQREQRGD